MFAQGQSYVALSRYKSWNDVKILALTPDASLVDERIKKEYLRLEEVSRNRLPI